MGKFVLSDGTDQNSWEIRYDDGEGDTEDNPNFQFADQSKADVLADGYFDLFTPTFNTSSCGDMELSNGSSDIQDGCSGINMDNSDDGCAVKVTFENNKIKKIYFVCFTGASGDVEYVNFSVSAGLRESCTEVAQTEESS